jgi:protein gp37
MKLSWAREIRDQCQNAGVRFFFKQVSGRHPQETEIPTDLFIREFPVEANRTIYG